MTIQELVDKIEAISLAHNEVNSFHVGNTWDMAASKSSDIYPAVWCEFPVLVSYEVNNQKKYSFSLDVLAMPHYDNTKDEMNYISHCEQIADQLLYALRYKIKGISIGSMSGLSVKAYNADIACGVRIDLEVVTGRECEPLLNFDVDLDTL